MERNKLKWIYLSSLLFIIFILIYTFIPRHQYSLETDTDTNEHYVSLQTVTGNEIRINTWLNNYDNNEYLFLPSFAQKYTINDAEDIHIMRSENIKSCFINLEGDIYRLNEDKNHIDTGDITFIDAAGRTLYQDNLTAISGRGNSSFSMYVKKPYRIKLAKDAPLVGDVSGKRWYLLPITREGSRINTKVAYDVGKLLGLAHTPEVDWVDLYVDGSYLGNYLIAQPIDTGSSMLSLHDLEEDNTLLNDGIPGALYDTGTRKGFVKVHSPYNISGGYLIEKDYLAYYENESCGFITDEGNPFTIKSPSNASIVEVDYIADFVQSIEDLIMAHDESYLDYIDMDSFIAKYLVDEITLNQDANITSVYFYKDQNKDILYAGPIWDYDSCFGEINGWDGIFVDYHRSINDAHAKDASHLQWDMNMLQDKVFSEGAKKAYEAALPDLVTLLTEQIDTYADWVNASAQMDLVRWRHHENRNEYLGNYQLYESNIRYLKFFFAQRLNYLIKHWDIDYPLITLENTDTLHSVQFWQEDTLVAEEYVKDGDLVTTVPELTESYTGWFYQHSGDPFHQVVPIYEDVKIIAD